MSYHTDRDLRLSVEEQKDSLYGWSLQEFTKEGAPVGRHQIPWKWSLFFTASELHHCTSLSCKRSDCADDDRSAIGALEEEESIQAALRSGVCKDGEWDREVVYSMFRTGREIKSITLDIYRLGNDAPAERCSLLGGLSYTSEIEFRDVTTDDWVGAVMWVPPSTFDALREAVNDDSTDTLRVMLTGVAGFYSEWSPSISTRDIKVLLPGSEHPVSRPDGCDIDPPRLGQVQSAQITLVRRKRLALSKPPESGEPESLRAQPAPPNGPQRLNDQLDSTDYSQPHVEKTPAVISKLMLPLWVIAGLLGLIWLRLG